jgi:hypothetical protein
VSLSISILDSLITSDDNCRTNWALCVDTSEIKNTPSSDKSSSFIVAVQKKASEAKERVVALIYFLPADFSLEDGSNTPVGKHQIVACRTAFRQGAGDSNVMKGLFEMIHDTRSSDQLRIHDHVENSFLL